MGPMLGGGSPTGWGVYSANVERPPNPTPYTEMGIPNCHFCPSKMNPYQMSENA